MLKITLDFESFYSREYSLRKMTPVEYILGAEFETIGCAVKVRDKPTVWLEGDRVASLLRKVNEPWMCITHNALFDCSILAWRYDIHPTLCVDTMSMARALLSPYLPRASVSLETVSTYLNLGHKEMSALGNVMGMRLRDIKARPALYDALVKYALGDADKCRGIFDHVSSSFPAQEFIINDMIIKMATRPQFAVDQNLLYEHLAQITDAKTHLLERANISKLELMSNDKFAVALRNLGVEPATKISPATGKETYAFAKTDEFMDELQEHGDPDVQALVAARLGLKSTLEETRTQRFINISRLTHDGNEAWMPIALRFSGAHTHRFSGDWKLNQQNLPSRKSRKLRQSLKAPEGRVVLAADSAQIEARLTAWLAKCAILVKQFTLGEDVYSIFATEIYGFVVTKKDKIQRFLGKTSILGLGFGMGGTKFDDTVRIQAADQNIEIDLAPLGGAKSIVDLYRRKYPEIPATWKRLDGLIQRMAAGRANGETFGPCIVEGHTIRLPGGLPLQYPDLKYDPAFGWSYWDGRKRKPLWGGTLLENIVQYLDRQAVMEAAVRIQRRVRVLGINMPLAHQVHDELVYVPRIEDVSIVTPIVEEEMFRRPSWGPDLPLAAETKSGVSFGDVE